MVARLVALLVAFFFLASASCFPWTALDGKPCHIISMQASNPVSNYIASQQTGVKGRSMKTLLSAERFPERFQEPLDQLPLERQETHPVFLVFFPHDWGAGQSHGPLFRAMGMR